MIKPFKIEIVDPETNIVITNLWNVGIIFNDEDSTIEAWMYGEHEIDDRQLEIKIKE